jgi:hypothetical protein
LKGSNVTSAGTRTSISVSTTHNCVTGIDTGNA